MRKRNLLESLLLIATMSIVLGGAAHANNYTGNCADFPTSGGTTFDGNGDVDITDSSCSLSQSVTATGHVHIFSSGSLSTGSTVQGAGDVVLKGTSVNAQLVKSTNNSVTIQATDGALILGDSVQSVGELRLTGKSVDVKSVTATNNQVYVESIDGTLQTKDVSSVFGHLQMISSKSIKVDGDVTAGSYTKIFKAQGNISLKTINGNGGDVRIFANQSGSGAPSFKVGDGSTNGLTAIKQNSSGWSTVYLNNGDNESGIEYNTDDAIQIRSPNSSLLVFDGHAAGKITLAAKIDLTGSSGGGEFNVYAPELITNNATVDTSGGSNAGKINFIVNKVTDNSGLTLKNDGYGLNPDFVNIAFTPVGNQSVTASDDPDQPAMTFGPFLATQNPLVIQGDGSLTINATGDNMGIKFHGYPLTIATSHFTINQQGGWNKVTFDGWDGTVNAPANAAVILSPLMMDIHLNTTSSDQGPGYLRFAGTSVNLSFGKVVVDGAGKSGGAGSNIDLDSNTGNLKLGTSTGAFSLVANGSITGGSAGNVNVLAGNSTVVIDGGDAILASAQGGNGKGGFIDIEAASISASSTTSSTGSLITADGKGTGDGGTIKMIAQDAGSVVLGTSGISLSLSATNIGGSGAGGNIELGHLEYIFVRNDILVSAGNSGDGQGGTLNFHDFGSFQITPAAFAVVLDADGHGSGKGGVITILSQNANTMVLDNGHLSASAATDGSGSGGEINITGLGAISVQTTSIKANAGGTGGDGGTILLGVYDYTAVPIDLSNAVIEARSDISTGTAGAGGTVTVTYATGTIGGFTAINVPTIIKVNGGDAIAANGYDGAISLNGVTCQQWRTVAVSFPKTAWDCITPDTGSYVSTMVAAGNSLSTVLQNQLATLTPGTGVAKTVGLYAMNSLADYETFFTIPHGLGGYDNQYGTSYVSYLRASMTFSYSSNGDNAASSHSPTIMVGALVHELGHQLDYMWGPGLQNLSSQTAWDSQISPSFAAMDALTCAQVFSSDTCTNYSGTNSQIFDARFSGIGHRNFELFAAMFAHVEASLTGAPPSYSQDS